MFALSFFWSEGRGLHIWSALFTAKRQAKDNDINGQPRTVLDKDSGIGPRDVDYAVFSASKAGNVGPISAALVLGEGASLFLTWPLVPISSVMHGDKAHCGSMDPHGLATLRPEQKGSQNTAGSGRSQKPALMSSHQKLGEIETALWVSHVLWSKRSCPMLVLPVFKHHVGGKHREGLWAHMKLFSRQTKNLGSHFQS